MSVGLTRALARRALGVRYEALPDFVIQLARQCVLDTLGVSVAGADDPLVRILGAELNEMGGTGVATVWGSSEKLPALSAALLNGTISHALDYDDVNMAMPGHPSVAVLPAVLALAEERGASFAQMLAAFVAGYETACRLGMTLQPGHYDGLGFHATGTIGAFGAAAGCAHLLGLDEERTVHALGIVATQAAGLKSQFGTMCKPLHAGKAAQNGLLAARLAARGFTSRVDAIECRQGFASTHSPDFHPEKAEDEPEGGYYIRANLFKYHAACYLTHAGIESARRLRLEHSITPEQIAAITIRVGAMTDRVCNIPTPRDGLEIKFSHRMTAAMALAGTDTGRLDVYSEATAADPALVALRDLINIELMPDYGHTQASMELRLRDQTSVSTQHDSGVPAASVSVQGARLAAKFAGLVAPVMGDHRAADLAARVETLEAEKAEAVFA